MKPQRRQTSQPSGRRRTHRRSSRDGASRTCEKPFQISLNLRMRVDPLDDNTYRVKPLEANVDNQQISNDIRQSPASSSGQNGEPPLDLFAFEVPRKTHLGDVDIIDGTGIDTINQNTVVRSSPALEVLWNEPTTLTPMPSTSLTRVATNALHCDVDVADKEKNCIESSPALEVLPNGPSNSIPSFSNVPAKALHYDLDITDKNKPSSVFRHRREIRLGFLANDVPVAVNVVLNLRTNERKLYLEPVELLYDNQKVWRRRVRDVVREIEALQAARKNQGLNASGIHSDTSCSNSDNHVTFDK